jgi:integrase
MADTGARISEALSLRWDRITLQGTTPVIGKGGKTRVLGFTPRATRAMVGLGRHSNPHVFTNWRTAKVYNASTVRRWFRDAIAAAGLEGVKADGDLALVPHILRHSFASIADERGARAEDIQAALGHEHASTTRVYLHRNEANAAMRMAAIMAKPAERRPPRRAASEKYDGAEKEVVKLNGGRLTSLVS